MDDMPGDHLAGHPDPLEQEAVAMLSSGASYQDAMNATGLSFAQVVAAWSRRNDDRLEPSGQDRG